MTVRIDHDREAALWIDLDGDRVMDAHDIHCIITAHIVPFYTHIYSHAVAAEVIRCQDTWPLAGKVHAATSGMPVC